MTDQASIVEAMRSPAFYPLPPDGVEYRETHISHLFIGGSFVYKLKKAVVFPFLDYSSVSQRRRACEEEVRLNRRLAPGIYLGVLPVTIGRDGRPRLGGGGELLDYVVWMRRLPEVSMLDARLQAKTVSEDMIRALARRLAMFHAQATTGPIVEAHGDPQMLRAAWADTARGLLGLERSGGARSTAQFLAEFGPSWIERHEGLLGERERSGRIREGHGDLKAEHVCILDEPLPSVGRLPPVAAGILIYDCVEFSRALRCTDAASELAFLSIDLDAEGFRPLSTVLIDEYVRVTADHNLRAVLPFYQCYRAMVHALVDGLKAANGAAIERGASHRRSTGWMRRAVRYAWEAESPCVIVCCGRSGTGKTSVAASLATTMGFDRVSSDELRKRLCGIALSAHAPAAMYTPAARAETYLAVVDAVRLALAQGRGVVVDATCLHASDRHPLVAVARCHGAPLLFLECTTSDDIVHRRLAARPPGPSDATFEVFQQQAQERDPFGPDEVHHGLDTSGDLASNDARALDAVWHWRRQAPDDQRVDYTPYRTISGCAAK